MLVCTCVRVCIVKLSVWVLLFPWWFQFSAVLALQVHVPWLQGHQLSLAVSLTDSCIIFELWLRAKDVVHCAMTSPSCSGGVVTLHSIVTGICVHGVLFIPACSTAHNTANAGCTWPM